MFLRRRLYRRSEALHIHKLACQSDTPQWDRQFWLNARSDGISCHRIEPRSARSCAAQRRSHNNWLHIHAKSIRLAGPAMTNSQYEIVQKIETGAQGTSTPYSDFWQTRVILSDARHIAHWAIVLSETERNPAP